MELLINYEDKKRIAILSTDTPQDAAWTSISRMCHESCLSTEISGSYVFIPWKEFLAFKAELGFANKTFFKVQIQFTQKAKDQLLRVAENGYYKAVKNTPLDKDVLLQTLKNNGFTRELTNKQIRNVQKLVTLPAGATFSVPGAGKTTEALAFFYYGSRESDRLLVVAPKNAFSAWDEQLKDCAKNEKGIFVRLRGGEAIIKQLLASTPRFSIISYQQFPRVKNTIYNFLTHNDVYMFLDESHRIKSGSQGVSADAIVAAAHLPYRKLILSGTPMPQAEADLEPQLSFLYPEISVRTAESVAQLIQPVYVRTTKSELGLPPVETKLIQMHLPPKQQLFYNLLSSETLRQVNKIPRANAQYLRRLGKSIMKLMQFVSNPALLADDIDFMFSGQLAELLVSERSIKIDYACKRARELAKENKKVIIWSSFVSNVELISNRLADIGADYIHGGVDAGSEDECDTREGKIKRFHQDSGAMVLVANPAAASEGISLHKICHNAIYVDRSFNAAQFLQSEDRIHRYGLEPGTSTMIEILECVDTVDQIVTSRLIEKIERMATVLNDDSLKVFADPYAFDDDVENCGIDSSDVAKILGHLRGDYHD